MGAGTRLRKVMAEKGLVEAMAAHSPLSAMLAAEAGFDAIWASGFELSALYGVPDVSIVSMTQHLDMTRAIAERSGLPVVADIDTGFGNAINVLYAVEQYERAGVGAIVMEDKSFPKVTSLIAGGRQDMVRIEEFQGKIEAARSARRDPDLVIVARTEALIAGLGQDRPRGGAKAHPQLARHDLGQGGLAQPRRAEQQHMVHRLAAPARRLDEHLQIALGLFLADEIRQHLRPQGPVMGLAGGRFGRDDARVSHANNRSSPRRRGPSSLDDRR